MELNKMIEQITREVLKELGGTGAAAGSSGINPSFSGTNAGGGYNKEYAKYMDHTVLKADTTRKIIEKFCSEAKEYGFAAVCVNPTHVRYAASLLKGSGVKVATVIGFPLGANTPIIKAAETRDAIANGAEEVDMVINVGALKDGDYDLVAKDIKAVVDAAAGQAAVKVIIETCLLNEQEKIKVCLLAKSAGADFVKTSTGFGSGGATVEDVELMKKTVGPDMQVKASTGVKTREDADRMIKAGATRLGTSSGIAIVKGNSTESGCVNCGLCSKTCPTGNAQVTKSAY